MELSEAPQVQRMEWETLSRWSRAVQETKSADTWLVVEGSFMCSLASLARAGEAIYRHHAGSNTRIWRFSQSNFRVRLGSPLFSLLND